MNLFKWWGYKHNNGTLHAKRYFRYKDIEEAIESPFVFKVVGPFKVNNRKEALEYISRNV